VPRIVLVTSALPGEGKSTIAKGIALSAAQQGRKVLLIEADLYRPSLARDLGIDEPGGLSLLLYEEGTNPEEGLLTPLQRLPNLQVLQAGMLCEEVVELLGSNRMSSLLSSYRERFDTIVLDGPPVLPVSDAVSLSMLADTTLMVARMGQTPRIPFNRACNKLQMHNPLCDLRVVLNAVRPGSYEFHNYYGDISIPASKEQINASA
jgi:capsular exopolysaccharide synthesis family protein